MQPRWTDAVYKAANDAMPEAVVISDTGGIIRVWNPGSQKLFGFAAEEALGAPLSILIPERFRATHDAGFAKAVATGHLRVAGRVLATRSNHKDESRKLYVDFTFSLLVDEAGAVYGVMAVGRDATEKFLAARANQPAACRARSASGKPSCGPDGVCGASCHQSLSFMSARREGLSG